MDFRKYILKETGKLLLGEAVCVGLMLGVFAMLGKFDGKVVAGGALGGLLSVANFFFMSIGVSLASDKAEQQNVSGGKLLLQNSMLLRYVLLALILFAAAKSGWFQPIALVLPLVFVRPLLMFFEFFRKSGEKS